MIELQNVTKTYGGKTAVRDLTLSIPRGELFAFLGPNGAGKTTTIKMMCGLLFPTSGSISIAGFDLRTHGQDARRHISYVPDQPYLYDKLSGREILEFTANMYGMPKDQAADKIAEVIELFSLGSFADILTQNYSHGMRQRTVFAAAFLHHPDVLIVDEPTVGLDPHHIRLLKDLLRRQADRGVTVFLSTHSLDIAEELADRIGVIHQSKLIALGTLASLRQGAANNGSLEDVFLKLTQEIPDEAAVAR
ncbi:MAG: ABC transporter ATP-binding protein [Planctomycetota bacterium]|jgi:ABC-2 type transport system ATP-binding protein